MVTDVRNRNMAGDSITNGFNNMLLVEGRLHVVFLNCVKLLFLKTLFCQPTYDHIVIYIQANHSPMCKDYRIAEMRVSI